MRTMIIGSRICLGTSTIFAKVLIPVSETGRSTIFAMRTSMTIMPKIPLLSSIRRGPAITPWADRQASSRAVALSPGMPRVSIGITAPPTAALLELSEATRPSMAPSPKGTEGFLQLFLARS